MITYATTINCERFFCTVVQQPNSGLGRLVFRFLAHTKLSSVNNSVQRISGKHVDSKRGLFI